MTPHTEPCYGEDTRMQPPCSNLYRSPSGVFITGELNNQRYLVIYCCIETTTILNPP